MLHTTLKKRKGDDFMRNYVGRVHCPHCARTFNFKVSKRAKTNIMLGDYVLKRKSLIEDFEITCNECHHKLPMKAVIRWGQLVAFELGNKKLNLAEYKTIPEGTYALFSYEERQSMFMGEDNLEIINISKLPLAVGVFANVFGKRWRVNKIFKEVSATGNFDTFICEVSLETDSKQQRLLILKDRYFPTLKEVNWRKPRKTGTKIDDLIKLSRYDFSRDKEIVLCLDNINF